MNGEQIFYSIFWVSLFTCIAIVRVARHSVQKHYASLRPDLLEKDGELYGEKA